MPNVFFRSRPTRLGADEVRRGLESELCIDFPGASFEVGEHRGAPLIAWQDGPSATAVAGVVARIVNWPVRTPAAADAEPSAGPEVVLDRRFSDAALAVAVVRYHGSHVRPYTSERPDARADLSALLDVDGPERSGYPVVDAMADLLLGVPEPHDLALPADATRADRLAAVLTAAGYDRLWARAWSQLE